MAELAGSPLLALAGGAATPADAAVLGGVGGVGATTAKGEVDSCGYCCCCCCCCCFRQALDAQQKSPSRLYAFAWEKFEKLVYP